MVKKLLGTALLSLAFAAPAFAQETKTEKKQETTEMGKDPSKSTTESSAKKKDAKGTTDTSTKSTDPSKAKKTDKEEKETK